MNLFDILEGRMQQLFEGNRMLAPLPFKKLARAAVGEMKRCAVKVDGRRLAPTLYTILVNPADDATMAPLYQEVTNELVDFLAHEAANVGLEMSAAPVVRFIAEQGVRPGKPDVIAEVVTPDVLEEIRREESAYATAHSGADAAPDGSRGARPMQRFAGAQTQLQRPQRPAAPAPAPAPARPAAPTPAPAPARPSGAAQACQLTDTGSGRTWRIGVDKTVLGRESSSADLILPDTNVSRRHAELLRTPQGWVLHDLNSTNGTRVNGQRVTQATLHDGDTVSLGLIQLEFREL